MADILLIHGSCHGAWCWRDTIPALEALGHEARAIDMPSHGSDPTPIEDVTLESCARSIADALGDNTVIVAHSWGGFPATLAADLAPEHAAHLIYLCAYMPREGHSLVDMRRLAPRQTILKAVNRAEDGQSYTFRPEYAREIFYADCPEETLDYVLPRLTPQAAAPQNTPAHLGPGHRAIPRSYIRCLQDMAIPPELQAEMAAALPQENRHEMKTSHSPFFSDPKGLAALIDKIIG